MYQLNLDEVTQVSGGCPVCAITSACALVGASGMAVALTTNQIILLTAFGIMLTASLLYYTYHTYH
jgi:hypothetical protein